MRTVLAIFLIGCGGSTTSDAGPGADSGNPGDAASARPSCTEPRCPADPKPNGQVIAQCQSAQASACGNAYDDWARCVDNGTMCDPATKTTDPATKIAALNACKPKYDALQACCMSNQVTCPTAR